MAISDFIKKHLKTAAKTAVGILSPTADLIDKIVGYKNISRYARESIQSTARGYAGAAEGIQKLGAKTAEKLTGQKFEVQTLKPTGRVQKAIFGTDKPITSRSVGEEFPLVKKGGKAAPVVGTIIGSLDLIPGGSEAKGGAVALLKGASKADDTFRILTKTLGLSEEIAAKYADDAARLTDSKALIGLVQRASKEMSTVATKTRGFVESAKEIIPQAEKIAGQYVPRSTDSLAIKAKNLISEDFLAAEKMAMTGSDDSAVAVASELLKKYADDAAKSTDPATANALYDKAAEVANTLAPKLTEQGRAIQAASILGRLTPEGQVRFAAREVQRFNETVPFAKRIPELSGEQAGEVAAEMKAISEMADGTEKAMRFQKLQNMIQDLVPTPLMKKITTVWKAGLLTGLKTQGLNVFSNLFHNASEVVKDVPAAIVDSAASLFTGTRTKTLTTRGLGSGLAEGFEKGVRYFKTGFDERDIGSKLDYHRVNFGKGAVAKAFQGYTDTVFRFLGAQDQPFYYGALSRSLMDQALAQGKNAGFKSKELVKYAEMLVESPTEEMVRYAVSDATTAVFQNSTKLGEVAKGVQKLGGGIGEIVLPFGKTPSAVAMQIINYSPIGIAKTIIENIGKGRFDQRLFSQGVGRGLTGTAIIAIGVSMAKKGMISLDFPLGDEREQELQKAEGTKENSIKVDGKWRSPMIFGPAGNLLLIGAHFQNALETSGSPTEAFSKTVFGGLKSFTEQTFLTGLKDAVNALTDPKRYAKSYLPNLLASLVPTIVSDVAKTTDPLERRAETTVERIQARVPGARRSLEPQVDIIGRERERVGNPLETLADPTRPSKDVSTPVTGELRRLTDAGFKVSPTALGDKKGFKGLTQEENTRLWKFAGGIINDKLESLFSKEVYQKLDDEKKGKAIEKVIDQAKVNARAGMVIEFTEGLTGEELKSKLSELKAGGLLTKEVLNKYVELR
jgi:hypothetical protein